MKKQFIAFIFVVLPLHAAEFKVTCDANRNLTDFDYNRQTDVNMIIELGETDKRAALGRLCENVVDCLNHLGQVGELAGDITDAMEVIERREYARMLDLSAFGRAPAGMDPDQLAQMQTHLDDINQLLDGCRGAGSNLLRANSLTLFYPWNARGNGLTSAAYDRTGVEDIVRTALLQGVDPYFALAITMMENPPVSVEGRPWESNSYANAYGSIPIDAVAAYDLMGCYPPGTSGNSLHEAPLVKPASEISMRIAAGTNSVHMCAIFIGVSGARPGFEIFDSSQPGQCCMRVQGDNINSRDVLDGLGARLMKRIQTNLRNDRTRNQQRGPYFALGYNAQRYNGLGTFGATEQMENRCLSRVNMAQRPVYGLLVQDVIANSLMTNAALNTLVRNVRNQVGGNQKSVYCEMFGAGTHEVDSREFLRLQRELLLEYTPPNPTQVNRTRETTRRTDCTRRGETFEPFTPEEVVERLESL